MDKEKLITRLSEGAKRRHLIVGSLIFFVIMIFLFFSEYGLITRFDLQMKKSDLKEEIVLEKEKTKLLKEQEKRLKNDTLEIEKVAREKYGYSKKGEKIFYIDEKNLNQDD